MIATWHRLETDVISIVDDVTVRLIDHMGSDAAICQAARVSTAGENDAAETDKDAGLIRYLMKHRHGSPFEHGALKFFVEAPIFVVREFHRHRVGWGYNEMSGRYRQLEPRFYAPKPDRKLVNVGTSARPEFAAGGEAQAAAVNRRLRTCFQDSWNAYQWLLNDGIANEVARMVLPVATMSQMYATCNPRSLMHFLSLRVDSPDSTVRSRPQWEIQLVAERMEAEFARLFPATHGAFIANGRTAP